MKNRKVLKIVAIALIVISFLIDLVYWIINKQFLGMILLPNGINLIISAYNEEFVRNKKVLRILTIIAGLFSIFTGVLIFAF